MTYHPEINSKPWHDSQNDIHGYIEDEGGDGPNQYRLIAREDSRKSSARNASINDHDSIHGTTVKGHANGGRDSYKYDGVHESIDSNILTEFGLR